MRAFRRAKESRNAVDSMGDTNGELVSVEEAAVRRRVVDRDHGS